MQLKCSMSLQYNSNIISQYNIPFDIFFSLLIQLIRNIPLKLRHADHIMLYNFIKRSIDFIDIESSWIMIAEFSELSSDVTIFWHDPPF